MELISKSSKVMGCEKVPIEKVLLTFSVTLVVKSKTAEVNPPPSTSCKPTISSKVPNPEPGEGG
jgi:hypothetical protein